MKGAAGRQEEQGQQEPAGNSSDSRNQQERGENKLEQGNIS